MKKYRASILMFLLFEGVAVTLWLTKSNLFYLFNFSYIGSCLSVGLALFTAGKRYARQFVQLAVGLYMLVYLGLMSQENMQIEGFWYFCFPACSRRRRFTTPSQKFSARCFSAAAGAVMPAGQPWS